MKLAFPTDLEEFRQQVREFLAAELPSENERPWRGSRGFSHKDEYDYAMDFERKLAARGWLALAWPKEYGGGGASHLQQLVFAEEMAYAGAPETNMGIWWVGPSIMLYGTPEQKARFLPRITQAKDWWCTLYSEPGAGSDLAALQTRATRDGDDFILNGQKIWTSGGHLADWGWLAARTDPDAPKHKGITMFVLDMKSPGVTVRPLYNMANRHHFNEVFFENVRVPATQVVGDVNRGWYHMAVALDFERSGISFSAGGRRAVERLVQVARNQSTPVQIHKSVKLEMTDRAVEVEIGTMLAYRVVSMQSRGLIPNQEASISKLFGTETSQRIALTGMHLLGIYGQLRDGSYRQVSDQAGGYLEEVAVTIGGGTSEIQRGIIATRGLGLPRG